jgi:transposase
MGPTRPTSAWDSIACS